MAQSVTQPTTGSIQSEEERQLIGRLRGLREQQRTVEDQLIELQAQGKEAVEKPNGAAIATIVAAGFGVFLVGLFTTLAEASAGIKDWLNFYNPTGPLSGKTTMAGILWLAAWVPGVFVLRNRELNIGRAIALTVVLVILGVLLTFPPVFVLFAAD